VFRTLPGGCFGPFREGVSDPSGRVFRTLPGGCFGPFREGVSDPFRRVFSDPSGRGVSDPFREVFSDPLPGGCFGPLPRAFFCHFFVSWEVIFLGCPKSDVFVSRKVSLCRTCRVQAHSVNTVGVLGSEQLSGLSGTRSNPVAVERTPSRVSVMPRGPSHKFKFTNIFWYANIGHRLSVPLGLTGAPRGVLRAPV